MRYTIFILLLSLMHTMYGTYPFTTIDTPGFYKLATNVTNQITITTSNVTLDMNGCTVSGGASGIVVNSALTNVTIRNGTINGVSDGILINPGCKDIILKEVTAKNCIRGITFNQVTDALLRDCDMVLNTTGFHGDTIHNIVLENCMASANLQAGYSLLTSTTCTFLNCKAIATGDGNTNLFGDASNIYGFISRNGTGNIFERCIANSTQGLTTTNTNSVVAGFALYGTEGCSKIINSEASNTTSALTGITIPYGILLQARFDNLVSVTGINPGHGTTGDEVFALDWSPDGKFLAVGGVLTGVGSNTHLFVYQFDRLTQTLIQITSLNPGSSTNSVEAVAWSPDGQYLAVGGNVASGPASDLYVYRFDSVDGTLTQVVAANPDFGSQLETVTALSWTANGRYLAVGGDINGTTNNDLFVYQFDRVLQTLTQVMAINPGGGSTSDAVQSVAWSPDGLYLAVGGTLSGTTNNDLFLYSFNPSSNVLTQIATANPGGGTLTVAQVAWTPDGRYLAVGVSSTAVATSLYLYRFTKATNTLTEVQAVNVNSGVTRSVAWSPNGQYLAVGAENATGNDLLFYTFSRSTESLQFIMSANPDEGSLSDIVRVIDWSPDGQYVGVGGTLAGITGNDLFIYRTLQFPENNVITGNTIYCNTGNNVPNGVGISGSSIVNLIIGNISFDNPFNYQFVCNVFNQNFGDNPSALQNESIGSNPILTPDDIPTRIKRTNFLLESLIDNLL